MVYIISKDRELTHPIRPVTEGGEEFKTTRALDAYAEKHGLNVYEVPTNKRKPHTKVYKYDLKTGKVVEV